MLRLNLRNADSVFKFGPPTWMDICDKLVPQEVVAKRLVGAKVCLLLHGFNVNDAMTALCRVTVRIEQWYDVIIGVPWPGSVSAFGFWAAERRADKAGAILADFCGDGSIFGSTYALDVQGHSCGCRVALEAVRSGMKVRNLVLAAAAVDNELVHIGQKYGAGIEVNTQRTLVAYSKNDEVLHDAFSLSSRIKRWASFDFGDDCRALGFAGPQNPMQCPINLRSMDFSNVIKKHGDYKRCEEFYAEWEKLCV